MFYVLHFNILQFTYNNIMFRYRRGYNTNLITTSHIIMRRCNGKMFCVWQCDFYFFFFDFVTCIGLLMLVGKTIINDTECMAKNLATF